MHFGQKDTEDDSVRITIFLQFRPLHLKGVSLFTSFPSTSSSSSSEDLTFESKEENEEDAAASSPAFAVSNTTSLEANGDTDMAAVAAVEVARVDEAAVGMGGGKSSSSPVFIAVVVVVFDFDFVDDDI